MYSAVKKNLDILMTIFHLGSSLPQSRQLGKDQNICINVGHYKKDMYVGHYYYRTYFPKLQCERLA